MIAFMLMLMMSVPAGLRAGLKDAPSQCFSLSDCLATDKLCLVSMCRNPWRHSHVWMYASGSFQHAAADTVLCVGVHVHKLGSVKLA